MNYPDYLPHHNQPAVLTEEQYNDPIHAIYDFFDWYDLVHARARLCLWIKTAFSNRRLRRTTLLEVLTLKEDLVPLLEAATLLQDDNRWNIPDDEQDIIHPRWYFYKAYDRLNQWHYQPRHLTERQYRNPARVFKQCTMRSTLPEWKTYLDSLFYAACYSNIGGYDGCVGHSEKEVNAHGQAGRLVMLLEAAHLVYVRERLMKTE